MQTFINTEIMLQILAVSGEFSFSDNLAEDADTLFTVDFKHPGYQVRGESSYDYNAAIINMFEKMFEQHPKLAQVITQEYMRKSFELMYDDNFKEPINLGVI